MTGNVRAALHAPKLGPTLQYVPSPMQATYLCILCVCYVIHHYMMKSKCIYNLFFNFCPV